MARALVGYVGNKPEYALLAEVNRLRRRVSELEAELAELRTANAHVDSVEIDLELHRIAEAAEPALAR